MLRPAIEAAVAVAQAGEAADPAIPAPPGLRRLLRFTWLPAAALDVARKVVDEDEEFRARVAAATTEEAVGRAGWVWLTRPEGWAAELDALRRNVHEQEAASREERSERDARKRLAGAEAAAQRAIASAALHGADAEQARAALDAEHEARQRAEAARDEMAALLATAREERAAAVRKLKQTEAELASRSADLKQAQHKARMLEAELELADGAPAPRRDPADSIDRERLVALMEGAAATVAELRRQLEKAALLVAPPDPAPAASGAEATPATVPAAARRSPLRLPPAVLEESAEAGAWLVRRPHTVVVVDGYNVSLTAWPDRPLPEQRARLVDALTELHARTGANVEIVFDGSEGEGPPSPPSRPGVRVRFSDPGVEADDVVIDRVADIPLDRPVLVVSSDRRVQEGARAGGANVLTARQLLAVTRR